MKKQFPDGTWGQIPKALLRSGLPGYDIAVYFWTAISEAYPSAFARELNQTKATWTRKNIAKIVGTDRLNSISESCKRLIDSGWCLPKDQNGVFRIAPLNQQGLPITPAKTGGDSRQNGTPTPAGTLLAGRLNGLSRAFERDPVGRGEFEKKEREQGFGEKGKSRTLAHLLGARCIVPSHPGFDDPHNPGIIVDVLSSGLCIRNGDDEIMVPPTTYITLIDNNPQE